MSVRVAINGFGRTGRAAFRAAYEREAPIDWVAVNDVADPAMLAHLLSMGLFEPPRRARPAAGRARGRAYVTRA